MPSASSTGGDEVSERARYAQKTSWRDSDPEFCCVADDKRIIARNRRREGVREIAQLTEEYGGYEAERRWLERQVAQAESLQADLENDAAPFGDGGFGHHLEELRSRLRALGQDDDR
jgi:hypothetical protein